MKKTVILKTGSKIDSLELVDGDYEDWIRIGMGLEQEAVTVIDAASAETLPPAEQVDAVVITGSGAMVSDAEDWMQRSALWLRAVVEAGIPVLGICFGHQLLAYALGGRVDYNPRGVEVGTMRITLTAEAANDPLLASLPQSFSAQLSHSQSVVALPPGARLLARSEMEPHQAFAWGNCAWGIQFHPEFDERIIPHFIDYYRSGLEEQGRSVAALKQAVMPTPHSSHLLQHFATIIRDCSG